VIEENGGRGHAAPTPNELGEGQEEEEEYDCEWVRLCVPESLLCHSVWSTEKVIHVHIVPNVSVIIGTFNLILFPTLTRH
jgi:hypothetical protein